MLLLALVASMVGLGALPASAQTGQAFPQPAIPQRYLDQPVTWQTCVFDSTIRRLAPSAPPTTCATIRVPMDWLHPDAHPDISLAVAFSFATGQSKGLLTANPGGPGTPAREFPAALAVDNPRLFTDYDLLGVDPRGFGASQPLTCPSTAGAVAALPQQSDGAARTARTHAAETAAARLYAGACSSTTFARFVSTQQMVYDLAFVRTLLGYRTLSYLGYGYGARLGAWYADTYPDTVAALVLDSSGDWSTNTTSALDPSLQPSAAAAEVSDSQWLAWLARRDDRYHLGTTVTQVRRSYAAVRAALAQRRDRPHRADGWELDTAVRMQLAAPGGFRTAAATLQAYSALAAHGPNDLTPAQEQTLTAARDQLDTTVAGSLRQARDRASILPSDRRLDLPAPGAAVRCNDLVHSTDVGGMLSRGDDLADSLPFAGYTETVDMCTMWPSQPATVTVSLAQVRSAVMIQPATAPFLPLANALTAHRAVPVTRLVTVADTATQNLALTGVSGCADAVVSAYLFDGSVPAHDQVCAATPLPGDTKVHPVTGVPQAPGKQAAVVPSTAHVNPALAGIWADAAAR